MCKDDTVEHGIGNTSVMVDGEEDDAFAKNPTLAVVEGDRCGDDDWAEDERRELELLRRSEGWFFPAVKLVVWDPENKKQWDAIGSSIARRNLLASVPNLMCAFGVWLIWSVIATEIQVIHDHDLNAYPFADWGSPKGKEYRSTLFLLPAIAGISGGTLRIPNSFMNLVAGGRNVVFATSIMLCAPLITAGILLSNNNCTFNSLIICALLSGIGGGAFASSMGNTSLFYPMHLQGKALGIAGGFGNLGASVSQLVAPFVMEFSFGQAPVAPSGHPGWPAHACWLWVPPCVLFAIIAFFYMSNQPDHGDKRTAVNLLYLSWMEGKGLLAVGVGVVTLIHTHDSSWTKTRGGHVAYKLLILFLVAFTEHFFMLFSPQKVRERIKKQAVIFKRKHTFIMTWLYIMCFGSFIGYSSSFPLLIVDLFGYIHHDYGCIEDGIFTSGGSKAMCESNGGEWDADHDTINPDAPNVFRVAWLGTFIGSIIRPVGGLMADRYGGAKMTMFAIIWTTAFAVGQGVLVGLCHSMEDPSKYYGLFVFIFLALFAGTGFMNGTTFRTMGVLFPPEERGPVLGWSSAIASYGAFIIPDWFGIALNAGTPEATFYGLAGYYVTCGILNFWYYLRPGCEKPGV